MKRNIYLHIGLPKTGTTSIQKFFNQNLEFYREKGLRFFRNERNGGNVSHMAALVLRPDVMTFEPETLPAMRSHLKNFLIDTKGSDILLSGESFSYLRTAEECVRLKDLFDSQEDNLIIILVLRNKDDFWESYENELKKRGHTGSRDENSRFYPDKDGWLTDFETLTRVLKDNFDDVRIIQYQENMVGHFCQSLGFDWRGQAIEPKLNTRASGLSALLQGIYLKYLAKTWVGKVKRKIFA